MSHKRTRSQNRYKRFAQTTRGIANIANTAATALKIATTVASLINVEFKMVDVSTSGNITDAGSITLLTSIAQGDGVSNREGNSVKLKSLRWNGVTTQHASATSTMVRHIIFLDVENAGSSPAVTDVLTSATTYALPNFDNRKRFIILHDRLYTYNQAASDRRLHKGFKKFSHDIDFTGAASTATRKMALYTLILGSEATNYPTQGINYRIRYVDN